MGITDFHCHILPGVDDGSASLEDSVAMLKMEASQGVSHVVATPHFDAVQDIPERFLARRNAAEAMLREEMEKHEGLPRLSVGAEVSFFPGMQYADSLSCLTMGGGQGILVEMPAVPWTNSMYAELEGIYCRQNLTPVVAHVDRYIRPFRTYGIPRYLERLPVLVQANAEFFLNRVTKQMALKLLRQNQIHLLGSDCHNLTHRKPNLGRTQELIQSRLGEDVLNRIRSYERILLPE